MRNSFEEIILSGSCEIPFPAYVKRIQLNFRRPDFYIHYFPEMARNCAIFQHPTLPFLFAPWKKLPTTLAGKFNTRKLYLFYHTFVLDYVKFSCLKCNIFQASPFILLFFLFLFFVPCDKPPLRIVNFPCPLCVE